MTAREALSQIMQDIITGVRSVMSDFTDIFIQGRGAELHDDDFKLRLSRAEDEAGYTAEYLELINTHKRRGSEEHITEDIERITNTDLAAILYHPQSKCGWVLGVTSPGFINGDYDDETSLAYMGLDNMLDIAYENNGLRSTVDIRRIIRKEFIPLVINSRQNLLHIEAKKYIVFVESEGGTVANKTVLNIHILKAIHGGYYDDIVFWTSYDFGYSTGEELS